MMQSLTTEQSESYQRDGYLFPLDVFGSGQVDAIRAGGWYQPGIHAAY
jgi:hypothetical protein